MPVVFDALLSIDPILHGRGCAVSSVAHRVRFANGQVG